MELAMHYYGGHQFQQVTCLYQVTSLPAPALQAVSHFQMASHSTVAVACEVSCVYVMSYPATLSVQPMCVLFNCQEMCIFTTVQQQQCLDRVCICEWLVLMWICNCVCVCNYMLPLVLLDCYNFIMQTLSLELALLYLELYLTQCLDATSN